jgi:type I restriction enzyme S subunit
MISLREVATINEATINPKSLDWLNYTDIASVGTRTVESPQMIAGKNAPGRARRVLRHGDTVLSTVRPNRKSYFQFKDDWDRAIASTGFAVISPKNFQDADYLYAVLTSDAATLHYESLCEGGAYPAFNPRTIEEMQIPWPSPEERNVVGGLSASILRKIETNGHLARTLEEIAQTIFKSWFVDFDPVKTKMAGEKPVGMDVATAALFPNAMEDSELGQIPTGWSVQEFGEVNYLLMGQSPPGDTYNSIGEGVPFYQGRTDFGMRFPKQRIFCTAGTRFAKAGEVLISVRAPVGDLNQAIEDCVIGRGVASAMHKSGSQAYSYALLCSLKPKLAYYNGEGTVFGAINRSDFNSLKVVEPPRQIVESFETVAGTLNEEIRNLFSQTETLIELRDSLFPRLISGELQIPEEMLVS